MTTIVKWGLLYVAAFVAGRGVARIGWGFDRVVDALLEVLPLLGADPITTGALCL